MGRPARDDLPVIQVFLCVGETGRRALAVSRETVFSLSVRRDGVFSGVSRETDLLVRAPPFSRDALADTARGRRGDPEDTF